MSTKLSVELEKPWTRLVNEDGSFDKLAIFTYQLIIIRLVSVTITTRNDTCGNTGIIQSNATIRLKES